MTVIPWLCKSAKLFGLIFDIYFCFYFCNCLPWYRPSMASQKAGIFLFRLLLLLLPLCLICHAFVAVYVAGRRLSGTTSAKLARWLCGLSQVWKM